MGRRVDRLHRPPATPAGEAAGAARAAPTTYPAPGQPGTSRPPPVAPGPASLAWPAAFAPAVVTRREIFRLAASSADRDQGTFASHTRMHTIPTPAPRHPRPPPLPPLY